MAILIREVDLDRELPLLMTIFNATFRRQQDEARFRWLYLDNPDGRATAWFAIDDRTGDVAGCTAVFPRRVRLGRIGQTVTAWNCGDFCIMPRFRTMGVALKLRRAARSAIDAGRSAFLYAHPNERMLPVHLHVGHKPLARMVRYAKVLGMSTGLNTLDSAASAGFRLIGTDCFVRRRHDTELASSSPMTEEYTALYEAVADEKGTALVRDVAYLDWRFRRNPVERIETLLVRLGRTITGYVTFIITNEGTGHVRDWLALDRQAWRQLFSAFLDEMRGRHIRSVSVVALETHPDLPMLRRFGFIRRPDTSMAVVYAPDDFAGRPEVISARNWYMTVGDRDN